jgi:RNA recognition motif-containing protein
MNSGKEIKCRKCGGNHLTIKCGKTNQTDVSNTTNNDNENNINKEEKKQYNNEKKSYNGGERKHYEGEKKPYNNERKPYNNEKKSYDGEKKPYNGGERKQYDKKLKVKAKINNLPTDISKEELYELCNDWGNIKYINVNEYKDESVAFIEFKEEEQCKYFIEALDNTPFDYRIIKISHVD